MKERIKEILEDTFILALKLIVDTILVLLIAFLFKIVKVVIEDYLYHQKLDEIDNKALVTIYYVSKTSVMILFLIFVIYDIFKELKTIAFNAKKS